MPSAHLGGRRGGGGNQLPVEGVQPLLLLRLLLPHGRRLLLQRTLQLLHRLRAGRWAGEVRKGMDCRGVQAGREGRAERGTSPPHTYTALPTCSSVSRSARAAASCWLSSCWARSPAAANPTPSSEFDHAFSTSSLNPPQAC